MLDPEGLKPGTRTGDERGSEVEEHQGQLIRRFKVVKCFDDMRWRTITKTIFAIQRVGSKAGRITTDRLKALFHDLRRMRVEDVQSDKKITLEYINSKAFSNYELTCVHEIRLRLK